jgi:hypothetical protein
MEEDMAPPRRNDTLLLSGMRATRSSSMRFTNVTEPLKLITYYCLNHSFWPLSNNIEVTCRLCRVKPGKSLTSQDREMYIKTHTKESLEINTSQIITQHPSKVHFYKPGL